MLNAGSWILICTMCLLIGYMIGDWKTSTEVAKCAKELRDQNNKDIQLIVDKILKSREKKSNDRP